MVELNLKSSFPKSMELSPALRRHGFLKQSLSYILGKVYLFLSERNKNPHPTLISQGLEIEQTTVELHSDWAVLTLLKADLKWKEGLCVEFGRSVSVFGVGGNIGSSRH